VNVLRRTNVNRRKKWRFGFQAIVVAVALGIVWKSHQLPLDTGGLPDHITPLTSDSGKLLLSESIRADFDGIDAHFIAQSNPAYCGPASSAIVLNALGVRVNGRKLGEMTFMTGAASTLSPQVIRKRGITLEELSIALRAHSAQAQVFYGDDLELDEFRLLVERNSATDDDYLLVNYLRSAIGQKGGGHISPIAAYHAKTDRILVMDVRRDKFPPIWIGTEHLWRATRTRDPVSGKSRGIAVVSVNSQTADL